MLIVEKHFGHSLVVASSTTSSFFSTVALNLLINLINKRLKINQLLNLVGKKETASAVLFLLD